MNTMPAASQAVGEFGVLAQESVAGMNRLGAVPPRRFYNLIDAEVAFGCRRWPQIGGFIRHEHCERRAIGIGIYRDACDASLAQRAHNAYGDLSSIGDQNFSKHDEDGGEGQP